jgi:ribosomal protein S18 acetylase RimI-like enzyme
MMKKIIILFSVVFAAVQADNLNYAKHAAYTVQENRQVQDKVFNAYSTAEVVPLDLARDTKAVLDLFRTNMYWLCADPNCTAEQLLAYVVQLSKSPEIDQLIIKVLRHQGQCAGFIAYQLESADQGKILLLAVPEQARGKGHGMTLIQHAFDALANRGVKDIVLDTSVDNVTAQRLYQRAGFKNLGVHPDFEKHLRFSYTVPVAKAVVFA